MEGFLNRYRNITVLLLVIFAQLLLLAVQVKNDQDVRVIRVWTVTAVTPVARVLEGLRGGSIGFVRNYILLHQADVDNRRLTEENGRLKVENIFLKNELNRADRAKALEMFEARTPSKMLAATVIGTGAGSNSKVVFLDRGSVSGVMRGMAVVTPDGIVGKVVASYPTASEVLLVTDPDFAAGVVSQKNQVRGTLKGDGTPSCKVDYIPLEEKIDPGDWFYTSGDDRIFPRGFPVGIVKSVRPSSSGQPYKEILLEPSGLQHGPPEDVLILVQGVHQDIPDAPVNNQPVYIAPPPNNPGASVTDVRPVNPSGGTGTEADKLRSVYQAAGEAQNHNYGEGLPGSKPPDFTRLPGGPGRAGTESGARGPAPAPAPIRPPAQTPSPEDQSVRPPNAPPKSPESAPKTGDPAKKSADPANAVRPANAPPKSPESLPKTGDPAKKQADPATAAKPPDTVRRTNQTAGAPGGPPRE